MRLIGLAFGSWIFVLGATAQTMTEDVSGTSAMKRYILVPKPELQYEVARLHAKTGIHVSHTLSRVNATQIVDFPEGSDLLKHYQDSGLFESVEPDIMATKRGLPSDPLLTFCETNRVPYEGNPTTYTRDAYQWYVHNTGEPLSLLCLTNGTWQPTGGTESASIGADIGAIDAWAVRTNADGIVIGLIDSGIDYTHPDLQDVLSKNEVGLTNFIACSWTSLNIKTNGDLMDYKGHGTEMAGVMVANWNDIGLAGLAPGARLVVAKTSTFALSEILICMNYCIEKKVKIINCSWGFGTNSPALKTAFLNARNAGILCVAAAVDVAQDYDTGAFADYPIQWKRSALNPEGLDNILSVTATAPNDSLYKAAGWGSYTIDLGAPGRVIPTTGIKPEQGYVYVTGTSVAAAITSASAALLMAEHPEETYLQIINRVKASVDAVPGLIDKTAFGGRLNLGAAIRFHPVELAVEGFGDGQTRLRLSHLIPGKSYRIQVSDFLTTWHDLQLVKPDSDTATIQDPVQKQRFYRVVY